MTEDRKSVHVRINGKVQGVWFRAWTEKTATSLGLDGWVRNCTDGTVEALFSGPAAAVDRMLDAAHEGPPMAAVSNIDAGPADPPREEGFRVLADA